MPLNQSNADLAQGSPVAGFASGANEGFQNFFVKPEEQRMQSKLALQMLSKKLEIENQAQLGQAQAMQGISAIPSNEMDTIVKQYHAKEHAVLTGNDMPESDYSGIKSPQGQKAALEMEQHFAMLGGVSVHQFTRPDGSQGIAKIDKAGRFRGEIDLGGVSSGNVKALQKAKDSYNASMQMADYYDNAINGLFTAGSGLGIPEQLASARINDLTQSNPALSAFKDNLGLLAAQRAKEITGRFNMAELPFSSQSNVGLNDTIPSARAKTANIRQQAYAKLVGDYRTLGIKASPDEDGYTQAGFKSHGEKNAEDSQGKNPPMSALQQEAKARLAAMLAKAGK